MTNLQEKEKMIKEFRSYKEYNIASIADAVNVRNDLRDTDGSGKGINTKLQLEAEKEDKGTFGDEK
jgi:hypothetical protein